MSVPKIPSTFPFRIAYAVGESFTCFYDLRARNGRVIILENFDKADPNSKIGGFSLMVVEFSHPNSAIAFMEDEATRSGHLGTELKINTQLGDKQLIAYASSPYSKSEGEVFYSIHVGVLVYRIAFELMELTDRDDPGALTAEIATSILEIYRDVGVKY